MYEFECLAKFNSKFLEDTANSLTGGFVTESDST